MKLTRQQLRKIISEALISEGIFQPSVPGVAIRAAGTGLGTTAGAIGGGAIGIPATAIGGPIATSAIGAAAGGAYGYSKSNQIASDLGYMFGDIPVDHDLHPDNIFNLFKSGTFDNKEELNDYIEHQRGSDLMGHKFNVEYYEDDFSGEQSEDFKAALEQLGYMAHPIGRMATDIAMFKKRTKRVAKAAAEEKSRSIFNTVRGYFGGDESDNA